MNHACSGVLGVRFWVLVGAVALSAACNSDASSVGEPPEEAIDTGGSGSIGREASDPEAGASSSEPEPASAGSSNDAPSGDAGSGATDGAVLPSHGGSSARPEVGGGDTNGGEASDAGAPSEAGAPGYAGNGGGGEAGTPGALGGTDATGGTSNDPASPVGEGCRSCGEDSEACGTSLARCADSPVCSDWLDCVTACTDAECARRCDESHRDAVLLTAPVYQCLCGQCSGECTSLAVCDQSCAEGAAPPAASPTAPATLAETGLYTQSGAHWEIAPYVRRFQPEFVLFSDYAEKERFIYLPRCAPIDTRDMDHWSFPVGTRVWKLFTQDGVRIETRVLTRYGSGAADWAMAAYQWPSSGSTDPTLAILAHQDGVRNVNGTGADIPAVSDCKFCHEKMTDRVLGFGAIQLSHDLGGGVDFVDLVDWGVLSHAPVRTGYDPPGDATAQAALGYLHANCGGCHNDTGIHVSLYLRLLVSQTSVESSWAYSTGVNALTTSPSFAMDRIEPGEPSRSSVLVRLQRDPGAGESGMMPPVGRELVDREGVAAVSAWIQALSR